MSNLTLLNLLGFMGYFSTKTSPFAYIYQQSVAHGFTIWDLQRLRSHFDLDVAKSLATALMCSRLDYCNPFLYGIADIDLTRLQRIPNQLTLHLLAVFHYVSFVGKV